MPKPKFSSRERKTTLRGSTVSSVSTVVEKNGGRKRRFVVKRLGGRSPGQLALVISGWKKIHAILRMIKVPTFPAMDCFFSSGRGYLKQKDFSKTGKAFFVDAWKPAGLSEIESGRADRPLLGIARDLALMHRNCLHLSLAETILAPWIFYRKPNGKIDRAIIDLGSIQFALQPHKIMVESNVFDFVSLVAKFRNVRFAAKVLKHYLAENPSAKHFDGIERLERELQ